MMNLKFRIFEIFLDEIPDFKSEALKNLIIQRFLIFNQN